MTSRDLYFGGDRDSPVAMLPLRAIACTVKCARGECRLTADQVKGSDGRHGPNPIIRPQSAGNLTC
jgi:hypothetical protein